MTSAPPPSGHRGLLLGTVGVLVVALITVVSALVASGRTLARANLDAATVLVFRQADLAATALVAERTTPAELQTTATNQAFANLGQAVGEVGVTELDIDSTETGATVLTVLKDPVTALNEAREQGIPATDALVAMLDLVPAECQAGIGDAALRSEVKTLAAAMAATPAVGANDLTGREEALTHAEQTAESLASSAQARLVVLAVATVLVAAGLGVSGWRVWVQGGIKKARIQPRLASAVKRLAPPKDDYADPPDVELIGPPGWTPGGGPPPARVRPSSRPPAASGDRPSSVQAVGRPAALPPVPRVVQPAARAPGPGAQAPARQAAPPVRPEPSGAPASGHAQAGPTHPGPAPQARPSAPRQQQMAQTRQPRSAGQPNLGTPPAPAQRGAQASLAAAPLRGVRPVSYAPALAPVQGQRREPARPAPSSTPPQRQAPPRPAPIPVPAPIPAPAQPPVPRAPSPGAAPRASHPATAALSAEQLGLMRPDEEPVGLVTAMTEALAQVSRPHQVRWTLAADVGLPPTMAPRLAHVVAELIDAATAKNPALVVLVTARTQDNVLYVTVSDRSGVPASDNLGLGGRVRAIHAVVERMGASLAARPGPGGRGTDATVIVPLPPSGPKGADPWDLLAPTAAAYPANPV